MSLIEIIKKDYEGIDGVEFKRARVKDETSLPMLIPGQEIVVKCYKDSKLATVYLQNDDLSNCYIGLRREDTNNQQNQYLTYIEIPQNTFDIIN